MSPQPHTRHLHVHLKPGAGGVVNAEVHSDLPGWEGRFSHQVRELAPAARVPNTHRDLADVTESNRQGTLAAWPSIERKAVGEHLAEALFGWASTRQRDALARHATDIAIVCPVTDTHLLAVPWHLMLEGRPEWASEAAWGTSVRLVPAPLAAMPTDPVPRPHILLLLGEGPASAGLLAQDLTQTLYLSMAQQGLLANHLRVATTVEHVRTALTGTTRFDLVLYHGPLRVGRRAEGVIESQLLLGTLQVPEPLGVSELAKLLGSQADRGGAPAALHLHVLEPELGFAAVAPSLVSSVWSLTWSQEGVGTRWRRRLLPAKAADPARPDPLNHGPAAFLRLILEGHPPPVALTEAFSDVEEIAIGTPWSRYQAWSFRPVSSGPTYDLPAWICQLDRAEQHRQVSGAFTKARRAQGAWRWRPAPAFLWYGGALQEPAVFHTRIEEELKSWAEDNGVDAVVVARSVEWPWDGVGVGGESRKAEDLFKQRLAQKYLHALSVSGREHGVLGAWARQLAHRGRPPLVYLRHTFDSPPPEVELRLLLEWWREVLIPAAAEAFYLVLGVAWELSTDPASLERERALSAALLNRGGALLRGMRTGDLAVIPLPEVQQIDRFDLESFFEAQGWPTQWPTDPEERGRLTAALIGEDPPTPEGAPEPTADWSAVARLLRDLTPESKPRAGRRRR